MSFAVTRRPLRGLPLAAIPHDFGVVWRKLGSDKPMQRQDSP
jgi:hypothetical protein